jgi:hypothetical protein
MHCVGVWCFTLLLRFLSVFELSRQVRNLFHRSQQAPMPCVITRLSSQCYFPCLSCAVQCCNTQLHTCTHVSPTTPLPPSSSSPPFRPFVFSSSSPPLPPIFLLRILVLLLRCPTSSSRELPPSPISPPSPPTHSHTRECAVRHTPFLSLVCLGGGGG